MSDPVRKARKPRAWVRWVVLWNDNWLSGTLHGSRKEAGSFGNGCGVNPVKVIKVTVSEVLPPRTRKPK